ncbi:MAG: SanA protein [Cytophagales bacterium]|nr:SanA protein [Cytophagales bacterium]
MNSIKKGIKWVGWGILAMILFIGMANAIVVGNTKKHVKEELADLKEAKIALVLGTSKSTRYGTENLFFKDRMKAAADLYHAGMVKHIIVSGDNRTRYYNEPKDMMDALMELEVPSKSVTMDYAGLRTLDSIVRCREVFDQEDIIIVTQKFHAYRGIFIARHYGIKAQAYSADFESRPFFKLLAREVIARPLAMADLFLLNKSPKYLGEKEILEIAE